jgi:hypothetical protein
MRVAKNIRLAAWFLEAVILSATIVYDRSETVHKTTWFDKIAKTQSLVVFSSVCPRFRYQGRVAALYGAERVCQYDRVRRPCSNG